MKLDPSPHSLHFTRFFPAFAADRSAPRVGEANPAGEAHGENDTGPGDAPAPDTRSSAEENEEPDSAKSSGNTAMDVNMGAAVSAAVDAAADAGEGRAQSTQDAARV